MQAKALRKLLAGFLSLCMVLTMLPGNALAEAGTGGNSTITGTVTSDGTSAVEATVTAYSDADCKTQIGEPVQTSNSDGSYTISGLQDGSYYIQAVADGYMSKTSEEIVLSSSATQDFTLVAAVTVSGKITDDGTKEAIGGATVAIYPQDTYAAWDANRENQQKPDAIGTATTATQEDVDSDSTKIVGGYSIDVPAGTNDTPVGYTIVASKTGYIEATLDTNVADAAMTDQDIALAAETIDATINVQTGEAGSETAVSGATITLTDTNGDPVSATPAEDQSTAGTYKVKLAAGSYTVKVEAAGYETVTDGSLTVSDGGANTVTITLTAAAQTFDATIKVQDGENNAVSDATITLTDSKGAAVSATPAEDQSTAGTYKVKLAAGTYTVKVEATGFDAKTDGELTVSDGGANTVTITLTAAAQTFDATIKVQDGENNAVSDATITLTDSKGAAVSATPAEDQSTAGTYKVKLAAGSYTVKVEVAGYETVTDGSLTVSDGGANTVTITLTATADADKVAAAKTAIAKGDFTLAQANAADADAVKTALVSLVNTAITDSGLTITANEINVKNFKGATAGDKSNPTGTAGSFDFDVTLTSGTETDTASVTGCAITATQYEASGDDTVSTGATATGGETSTTVDDNVVATENVTAAEESGSLTIDATATSTDGKDVNKITVGLESNVVSSIADSTKSFDTVITTNVAKVTLPNEAMKIAQEAATKVSLVVEKEDKPTMSGIPTGQSAAASFKVKLEDSTNKDLLEKDKVDLNSPIKLELLIGAGETGKVYVYYNNGTSLEPVSAKYDKTTGVVTLQTNHLSEYVVTIGTNFTIASINKGVTGGYAVTLARSDSGTISSSDGVYVVLQLTYGTGNAATTTNTKIKLTEGSYSFSGKDYLGNDPTGITVWTVGADFDIEHINTTTGLYYDNMTYEG